MTEGSVEMGEDIMVNYSLDVDYVLETVLRCRCNNEFAEIMAVFIMEGSLRRLKSFRIGGETSVSRETK